MVVHHGHNDVDASITAPRAAVGCLCFVIAEDHIVFNCRNALIRCVGDVLQKFLDAASGKKPILVWVSQVV